MRRCAPRGNTTWEDIQKTPGETRGRGGAHLGRREDACPVQSAEKRRPTTWCRADARPGSAAATVNADSYPPQPRPPVTEDFKPAWFALRPRQPLVLPACRPRPLTLCTLPTKNQATSPTAPAYQISKSRQVSGENLTRGGGELGVGEHGERS